MSIQGVRNRPSARQFSENLFDGNPCSYNHGFARHDVGVGSDTLVFHRNNLTVWLS